MDHHDFIALISGHRRGILPAVQRGGLSALSPFYALAVRARNRAFDRGWKKSHRAAVPVVSVGNITTGGTGKTPLVAWLANWFRERGVTVALLSRGYRSLKTPPRRSPGNDEKLVLDKLCPGVPHVQRADRVAGAKIAVEEHAAELLILDDGFQHRRLHRDLDIVLIDALNPFGYGRLLPRGLLREPLSGLRRAHLIVLTRADQCTAAEKESILATVRRFAPDCPVAEVAFRPTGLVNAAGESRPLSTLKDQSIIAYCGIGNPESFRRTIAACDVREFRVFADHYHYQQRDLDELSRLARECNVAACVTTLKDLVKIDAAGLGDVPLWAVQITAEILGGGDELREMLNRIERTV